MMNSEKLSTKIGVSKLKPEISHEDELRSFVLVVKASFVQLSSTLVLVVFIVHNIIDLINLG